MPRKVRAPVPVLVTPVLEQIKQLTSPPNTYHGHFITIIEKLTEADKDFHYLYQRITSAVDENESLYRKTDDLEAQIRHLNEKVSGFEFQIKTLGALNRSLLEENDSLRAKLEKNPTTKVSEENMLSDLHKTFRETKERNEKLEKVLSAMTKRYNGLLEKFQKSNAEATEFINALNFYLPVILNVNWKEFKPPAVLLKTLEEIIGVDKMTSQFLYGSLSHLPSLPAGNINPVERDPFAGPFKPVERKTEAGLV